MIGTEEIVQSIQYVCEGIHQGQVCESLLLHVGP